MKFVKKYWIILAIAALLLVVLIPRTAKIAQQANAERSCYLYEQLPDGVTDETATPNREYIEITYHDDSVVSGIHNITPALSDSSTATFAGVHGGEFINVIATVEAEGEKEQVQRVYKTSGDRLYVGYQPTYVPLYQTDEGVYMYEDINKLSFETDSFFLEKVNCTDVTK